MEEYLGSVRMDDLVVEWERNLYCLMRMSSLDALSGILGSFDLLLLNGGITITFIISRCRRNWVRFD